ncbi:MAG TPA: PAS domain S-box protein, partial [Candidatus Polarisedimenticolia bacterium]|nr:PAS domain S-box protein [Candidatus Polarisedimenticolia bacterium]
SQSAVEEGCATQAVLLATEAGPLGAVALAWSAESRPTTPGPHEATREAWIQATVPMLASVLVHHSEISKLRNQAERDKRWFKTLDEHLRVLDRERQKFAAVVNQTDTFVFVTDEERVIRWNNRAMAVLLPFDEKTPSWIGKRCDALCSRLGKDGPESCDCPIRRALEGNETTHQEWRPLVAGTPGVLYLTALPIKGLDGKPREAMVQIQDLTGLEALRQSDVGETQARHGAMVEAALDAIVSMDHAGRILEFNPAAERLFGHRKTDVLGADMAGLIIPERLREQHRAGMEHFIVTGEGRLLGHRFESVALRADGSEMPVEVTIARISKQGPPVFTGFIRDLTVQKSAENALRDAELRLRTVVSESPVVVFALDKNGIYTVSAGKGLAALGRREGEVVGKSIYDLYRDYPQVTANIDRCLRGEEFSDNVTVGKVSFEAHYTPVRNGAGEVVGLFGVATDVSERRDLESQLRHAQKMEAVGRLAGGVAHDFNNLLTVIRGQSEMLLASMPVDDPQRSSLEEVQKAAARGALLTRQLLAFSRKDVSTPVILDLGEVVRDMESMLRRLIGADVHLATRIGQWPLHVRADRGQVEQVLANLAVNARDAMPYGGELMVEVSAIDLPHESLPTLDLPPGPYVALAVTDEGIGIARDIQTHLFEPFFTTKEQGKGTGLGLSVVYGIVRQSAGDILVESEPGRGATFRILLPRMAESAAGGGSEREHANAPIPKGEGTILLVEDETAVRALARDFLRVFGYDVIEAASGEEAIALFETHRGALRGVVSDIVMPGMSGVELARHLIALEPGLKVLLVSGYAKDSFHREDLTRDGLLFLQKPYTLEDFGRKLAELTSGSSSIGDRSAKG